MPDSAVASSLEPIEYVYRPRTVLLSTTAAQFAIPEGATRLDPLMVTITATVYVVVVAIAVIVPASRALRIQPATILRAE